MRIPTIRRHAQSGAPGIRAAAGTSASAPRSRRLELRILVERRSSGFRVEIADTRGTSSRGFANQLRRCGSAAPLAPLLTGDGVQSAVVLSPPTRCVPIVLVVGDLSGCWRVRAMSSRPRAGVRISVVRSRGDLTAGEADSCRADRPGHGLRLPAARSPRRRADRQRPILGSWSMKIWRKEGRDDPWKRSPAGPRVRARGRSAAEVPPATRDRIGRQVPAGLLGPVVERESPKPERRRA